jgi:Cu-Zn family superoxide dismutase
MTFETHRISPPKGRALRRRRLVLGAAAPLAAACFLALAGCEPDDEVSSVADTTIEDEAMSDTAMTEEAWRSQASPDYREAEPMPNELPPGYPHTGEFDPMTDEDTASGALAEEGAEPGASEEFPAQDEVSAMAEVQPVGDSDLKGQLQFRQEEDLVRITGELTGLEPGTHALYLQQNGSCDTELADSAGGDAAAEAEGDQEGAPDEGAGEVEELGNIVAAEDGSATVDISDTKITLDSGPNSVVGKTLIVQVAEGLGAPPSDEPSSAAVGCAEIRGESFAQTTVS